MFHGETLPISAARAASSWPTPPPISAANFRRCPGAGDLGLVLARLPGALDAGAICVQHKRHMRGERRCASIDAEQAKAALPGKGEIFARAGAVKNGAGEHGGLRFVRRAGLNQRCISHKFIAASLSL